MYNTLAVPQFNTNLQQNAQANLPIIPDNGNPRGANNMPANPNNGPVLSPAPPNPYEWLNPSQHMSMIQQMLQQPLKQPSPNPMNNTGPYQSPAPPSQVEGVPALNPQPVYTPPVLPGLQANYTPTIPIEGPAPVLPMPVGLSPILQGQHPNQGTQRPSIGVLPQNYINRPPMMVN